LDVGGGASGSNSPACSINSTTKDDNIKLIGDNDDATNVSE